MFFKHLIADDFIRHQLLLSKKISHESISALLEQTQDPFYLVESVLYDNPHYHIETAKPNHIVILGKSFNKIDRPRKYNSVKAWLEEDGFPVLCNVKALREEYPRLSMLSDRILCLFVYACTYPDIKRLSGLYFPMNEDVIELFADGFEEVGVAVEWEDGVVIPFTKIHYIVDAGRRLRENKNAG